MYNESLKESINALMENKWIVKETSPQLYKTIRENQKTIRKFCNEKLGANLYVHGQFIMLEKIPDYFAPWMGIDNFREQDDYMMYCLILAFLEEKVSNEQFLLTDICDDIEYSWNEDESIKWSNFTTRMSFIRAMNYCLEYQLLYQIDGDTNNFKHQPNTDVLYEVSQMSRYVLRSYPEDYQQYTSFKEFEENFEQATNRENSELRRQKVYRKLLYTPAVIRNQAEDEFSYIRNYRNTIQDDLEKYTYFQLELFKNCASATNREEPSKLTLFPDRKNSSSIILQMMSIIWEKVDKKQLVPNEYGEISISRLQCETILEQTKERYRLGWSKSMAEKSVSVLLSVLLEEMESWGLCSITDEVTVTLLAPSGRLVGAYTKETRDKIEGSLSNGS